MFSKYYFIVKRQNRRHNKHAAIPMKIQNTRIIMNTAVMIITMPVDTIVEEFLNNNLQRKSIDLLTYRIE